LPQISQMWEGGSSKLTGLCRADAIRTVGVGLDGGYRRDSADDTSALAVVKLGLFGISKGKT
jgi:hypothetical protein